MSDLGNIKNCFFIVRPGEVLFEVVPGTDLVRPTLDGYAVIPREVYEALIQHTDGGLPETEAGHIEQKVDDLFKRVGK